MNWSDLLAALALVLILEGLVPFASPDTLRRALVIISQFNDRQVRTVGFLSIITGLVLLYFVRY